MTRDWDAATYDRVSAPQVEWAERVLERLPLRGDETGRGSGASVVAEQIESQPQLDELRRPGVHYGQGATTWVAHSASPKPPSE